MGFLEAIGLRRRRVVTAVAVEKKRGRPTKAVAAQRRREKLAEARVALEIRKLERELRDVEHGDDGSDISLADLTRLKKQLAGLGLHIVSRSTGEPLADEGWRGTLRDFLSSDMAKVLLSGLAQGMAQRSQVMPPTPRVSAIERPTAPAMAPASAAPPPVEEPTLVLEVPPGLDQLEPSVQDVVRGLAGLAPADAAAWLAELAATDRNAGTFVDLLCGTQDEQLFGVLDQVAMVAPHSAPLVAWLRTNPAWLFAVAAELRRRQEAPADG